MSVFDSAVEFVLKHEGGYVDNPEDPGGETKFGISKRAYPDLDIKKLTEGQAKEIYREDYWKKIKGDELPPVLGFVLLDTAVNCGVFRASIWLQMALQIVCKRPLKLDGIIGPKTIQATKGFCEPLRVAAYIIALRMRHYLSLNEAKFLKGWMNRIADLMINISLLGG